VWRSVSAGLDDYTRQWVQIHTDACLDTRVRGEQPESVLALKMTCLDIHIREMSSLVQMFSTADRRLVQRAVEAVSHLSSVRECADAVALSSPVPPPKGKVAEEVDTLRKQLAEVRALRAAGQHAKGLEGAIRITAEAEKLGYSPLLAEAQYQKGAVLITSGKASDAAPLLMEAYANAYQGHDDALAARSAQRLSGAIGMWLGRGSEGQGWGRIAIAAVARLGGNDELRANILAGQAAIYAVQGENGPAAIALASEALKLLERTKGPSSYAAADAHEILGLASVYSGDVITACNETEKAVGMFSQLLGPTHDRIGIALIDLSVAYVAAHRFEEAASAASRALAIHEVTRGPSHPLVAVDLDNLGLSLAGLGRCEEALAPLRRAVAISEAASHATYAADSLGDLGDCLRRLHRPAEARVVLQRGLSIAEQHQRPHRAAVVRFRLAQVLWDLQEPQRAIELARQAKAAGAGGEKEWFAELEAWLATHERLARN
jgi:tetratricopeptide (TPR) repeat protein